MTNRGIFLSVIAFLLIGLAQPAQAQVSHENSVISTLQTGPRLAAGENLALSIWLLDANGRLQDGASRTVYVWLESTASPGLISPGFGEGNPYLTFQVKGSLFDAKALITVPGIYTLHASLYQPSPMEIASGTQVQLANPDLHPITVTPGANFSPQGSYRLQTDGPVPFRMKVPQGEPGLAIRMALDQGAGNPLPANTLVRLSSPDKSLQVYPRSVETDDQGEIQFRLVGRARGEGKLLVDTGKVQQTIAVDIAGREALYYINRSRAVFTGGDTYLDAVPLIHEGRTYIPIRSLTEAFGGTISYEDGVISLSLKGKEVAMTLGENQYSLQGETRWMDAAPYLAQDSDRTMVPVRFLAEGLGLTVSPQMDDQGLVYGVLVQE